MFGIKRSVWNNYRAQLKLSKKYYYSHPVSKEVKLQGLKIKHLHYVFYKFGKSQNVIVGL